MATPDNSPSHAADGEHAPVCPFCREVYPGQGVCPVHDLPLVKVGSDEDAAFRASLEAVDFADEEEDDLPQESLDYLDLRFGRGPLFFAGVLLVMAFPLEWVETRSPGQVWSVSGLSFSAARDAVLWILPAVGMIAMALLNRCRSRSALASMQPALLWLWLTAATATVYATWGFFRGADWLTSQLDEPVAVTLGPGFYVTLAGLLLFLFGAYRVGQGQGRR